jgi:flagellar FliJ protein
VKKREFRLSSVLEYREQLEETAQQELALIARRLAIEEATLEGLEQDLVCMSEILRTSHQSLSSDELRMHYLRVDFLSRSIHAHQVTIMNVKIELEAARIELVQAAKNRKMLETLKERYEAEYAAETIREEHSVLDDTNNRRPHFSLEELREKS